MAKGDSEFAVKAKPFVIPKQAVWKVWLRVKANRGAAGIDEQSIAAFEADLKDNLYKLWNRMSSGSDFPPPVRAVPIRSGTGPGSESSGCRRVPQTARSRRRDGVPESFVTVTHPFHPLSGQRLRVLFERKLADGLAVSCAGGPLGSLMVPLAWTDRGVPAAAAPLTYEVLIDLAGVVSVMSARRAG